MTFRTGGNYFLCETEPVSDVQLLWMLSIKDFNSQFWFQTIYSCTASGIVGRTRPALSPEQLSRSTKAV